MLRGVYRQAKTLPTRGKYGNVIRSDIEAAQNLRLYMADLFARRLTDRVQYGDAWSELEGDPNGAGSEWNNTHFNLALKKCVRGKRQVSME